MGVQDSSSYDQGYDFLVSVTTRPTPSAADVDRLPSTSRKTCARCGYPAAKTRGYNWGRKALRRKTTGSGRCRYLKNMPRRAKNGFREGTSAKKKEAAN